MLILSHDIIGSYVIGQRTEQLRTCVEANLENLDQDVTSETTTMLEANYPFSALGLIFAEGIVAAILIFVGAVVYSVRLHSPPKHEDYRVVQSLKVPDDTIFPLLQPHLIPVEEIAKLGYSSTLSLVQILIGVIPTSDMALQIWPPAFESYNIIVPNFLNLPEIILGVKGSLSAKLCSIAMYESSRGNECAYCTSHCCSFGIRRGLDRKVFGDGNNRTPEQVAVANVAYSLGTVPCSLKQEHVQEIYRTLSINEIDWVIAAIAMFGSFNKLMDGLGIPLEPHVFAETVGIMESKYSVNKAGVMIGLSQNKAENKTIELPPPPDNWTTKLAVVYHGLRPDGALALDRKLLKDVPVSSVSDCMQLLEDRIGHSFVGIIDKLQQTRVRHAAVAVMLKNMTEITSAGLGVKRKLSIGIEYCDILENPRLKDMLLGIRNSRFDDEESQDDNSPYTLLIFKVGKELSYAPSRVTESLVQEIRECPELTAAMLVELVSFLATVQMLHRIESFYNIVSVISL
jgi:hypothetical protein